MKKEMRFILGGLFTFGLWLVPGSAHAQLNERLHHGDRIRAQLNNVSFTATVDTVTSDSLRFTATGTSRTLAIREFVKLERAAKTKTHGTTAFLVAAGIGGVIGAHLGYQMSCIFNCVDTSQRTIQGFALGAIVFGIPASVIGSAIRTTQWQAVLGENGRP